MLSVKLQLRQTQALVMTPQLMQSIRLLQLTHIELDKFVDEEIERNPLLERLDVREAEQPELGSDTRIGDGEDWEDKAPEWTAEAMSGKLDTSLENLFPDDPGTAERLGPELSMQWKSAPSGSLGGGEGLDIEDTAAAPLTLREHVSQQVVLSIRDPGARLIAAELTDGLDEAGYWRGEVSEVAAQLGADEASVEAVLAQCQAFEPAGIFARDLRECIGLQLARRDRYDPAMRALVAHLDLLGRRDFQALRRICGVDESDLVDMFAEIRALDPHPGAAFAGGVVDTIVPDIEVRQAADGTWIVELNAETLPRVLVDQVYYAQVAARARSQSERDFLGECLQNANWLTRSLDQRAKTILRVASEIVRQQDAFLVQGVRHLRPLNLRTVADAIGMHESTVSRVTANKYMLTPRGVFELRYFFTGAIAASGGGDAHSSEAVRDRIRQMIEEEAPAAVLSDDDIVDVLKKGGVDIARRTVAKYREGMSIPSSVQRRREKRAFAALQA
jgi:RNA polymerase sigma-54 factor